ncbi:MAG TPA: hypothetical protein DEQ40_00385 [Oxalobacteraceae bacterium]|jgi:hypothetical protein|nr:hypothetical protein [Oxalobacteraceae bacterium]
MKNAKLDFCPLERAESIMAQESVGPNATMQVERREQVRDLLMFSIATSLTDIAVTLEELNQGFPL